MRLQLLSVAAVVEKRAIGRLTELSLVVAARACTTWPSALYLHTPPGKDHGRAIQTAQLMTQLLHPADKSK